VPLSHAYTQTEAFEIRGEWWRPDGAELVKKIRDAGGPPASIGLDKGLPFFQNERDLLEGSDEDHACRGPLRFDPDAGLELSLLGSSEAAFPEGDSGYAIYGRTAGGIPVSLLNCQTRSSTRTIFNSRGGFADRQIFGHSLVHGAHAPSLQEFEVSRVEVRIPGLMEFLWGPTFREDGHAEVGLGGRGLETGGSEECTVEVDGTELLFAVGTRQASSWHSVELQREAVAQVRFEDPLPFHKLREAWIQPLERLVGFAIRRPALAERVTVLEDGRTIDVVQYQRRPKWTSELRADRNLVSYAALGDSFERFIRRWWQLEAEMEGVADFMSGAMGPGKALEPQLTALASVIEGYHRAFHDAPAIDPEEHAKKYVPGMLEAVQNTAHRALYRMRLAHAHEMTQRERLESFLERAGKIVPALGKERERLAKAVTATRNYFTHLAEQTPHVLEGVELVNANQLLSLAIECNLLLDLGVPPEAASKGVQRAYIGKFFFRDLQQRGTAWPESSG
jgi:hypothetical protein